jgi:hypothetical protein
LPGPKVKETSYNQRLNKMTKLQKYLIESDEINDLIKQHCQPYLKLLNGKVPLFRGIETKAKSGKKDVRIGRHPKGTPRSMFNSMNKWLKSNGHVPRDNAMICTSRLGSTTLFGQPKYVFPIGKFNYSWIKATDLNLDDDNTKYQVIYQEAAFDDRWDWDTDNGRGIRGKTLLNLGILTQDDGKQAFNKFLYTNKGFDKAYKGGYEIWFQCKDYYFIDWRNEPKGQWKK